MGTYLTVEYNGGTEGRGGHAPVSGSWRSRIANLRSRCRISRDKALGFQDAAIREHHLPFVLQVQGETASTGGKESEWKSVISANLKGGQLRPRYAIDAHDVLVSVALSVSRVTPPILFSAVLVPSTENPFLKLRGHFRSSASD